MSKPLFSVICPTYNSAEFISNTLKSVIEQTYAASEIVVVDDGSTDNTVQIILSLKKIMISRAYHAGFRFLVTLNWHCI